MRYREDEIHGIQYALLTEVLGRGKADVLESYLKFEGIDAVLVQEAISRVTHPTSFALVKIMMPRASIARARELLRNFH